MPSVLCEKRPYEWTPKQHVLHELDHVFKVETPFSVQLLTQLGGPMRSPKEFKNLTLTMGRSLHCQVEHHIRTKFATPILQAIDNFKCYDIF